MVRKCIYCGEPQVADVDRSFHKFPWNDEKLLEKWIENIKLGPNFKPSKLARLCSDHFEEECLSKEIKGTLLSGSIPTKFKTYKSSCIYCHEVKGVNKKRSYRKFPFENPILLQKWLSAMNLKDVKVTKRSLLCSDHFENTCFRKTGKHLILKSDAVPSLFARSNDVETHNAQKSFNTILNNNNICNKRKNLPNGLRIPKLLKLTDFENNNIMENVLLSFEKDKSLDSDSPLLPTCSSGSTEGSNSTLPPTNSGTSTQTSFAIANNFETPNANQCHQIYKEHNYDSSPRSLKRKLEKNRSIISTLRNVSRIQKQKITRLKKRVSSLTQLVHKIRKGKLVPQFDLKCLDTIAEDDVKESVTTTLKGRETCVH
ncbi:THAP domain-containing protein 3-like isoform X2 [Leptopilina heterotoma]|uniref:THAP domain-containing protein 3-like isoform X2 n=1 Tax=Leptopilina heterotoma TaxID=63436 RepID=UPI001CA7E990|nr:THAP domain-containing protein 3-like isoform X2 [Leptopilina heterotoma]